MSNDILSILLGIVGIGLAIGLTIIGTLGKQQFNKLNTKIDNIFNKLSMQIEGVEIRLKGELSRINSEIGLLREKNAMQIKDVNRDINYKIERLGDRIRSNFQ